jgi:hypothetical protein
MRSIVLLLAAPALLWATSGSAQNDDYERNGVILGVAGTYAINTFGDELETAYEDVFGGPASASVDDSLGISANAGYRFHPHLSAAVEAEWLDGFRSDLSAAGLRRVAKVDIEPWVITANAKGYPLTGRYQPFHLGGAVRRQSVPDSTWSLLRDSSCFHPRRLLPLGTPSSSFASYVS